MEVKRKLMLICIFFTITMSYYRTEGRDPVLHRVGGGRFTWGPKVNFTQWASHEHFYKGDWLYFGFDKHIYNVLEVNKTNYDNCIEKDFITNITRGGRDVYQLLEARTYYFLSGRGFCFQGMRIAISVKEFEPLLPQAKANKNFSPTRMSDAKLLLLVVVTTLVWAII